MAFCWRPKDVHKANELNEIYQQCNVRQKKVFNWKSILVYWMHKTLLMYKRFNACVIHTNAVQECYWIAKWDKNNNEWSLHYSVCVLSPSKFRMVLLTWRLALMKLRFSLLCDIRMPKTVIECWLKWKIESYLCANDRILSLMNVTSRSCSPFLINECVFSHNEQQKV